MPDTGLEENPVSTMDERLKVALQFARKHKMSCLYQDTSVWGSKPATCECKK